MRRIFSAHLNQLSGIDNELLLCPALQFNPTEHNIQRLLETDLRGKCTVVPVVHRLDTVAAYDQIAVGKGGKLVERVSYEPLIVAKGVLYNLNQGIEVLWHATV